LSKHTNSGEVVSSPVLKSFQFNSREETTEEAGRRQIYFTIDELLNKMKENLDLGLAPLGTLLLRTLVHCTCGLEGIVHLGNLKFLQFIFLREHTKGI
jgi:hypothetical protein